MILKFKLKYIDIINFYWMYYEWDFGVIIVEGGGFD